MPYQLAPLSSCQLSLFPTLKHFFFIMKHLEQSYLRIPVALKTLTMVYLFIVSLLVAVTIAYSLLVPGMASFICVIQ